METYSNRYNQLLQKMNIHEVNLKKEAFYYNYYYYFKLSQGILMICVMARGGCYVDDLKE